MQHRTNRDCHLAGRLSAALAALAVMTGALVFVTAGPAAATTVTDETSFRTAWTNAAETQIDLDADITLTCGAGGVAVRNSVTDLVLDGNGHTITQTCAGHGVLQQTGGGLLTLTDVTITGGTAAGDGGGVQTNGSVTLTRSVITGNTAVASGGGVDAAEVTVVDSLLADNIATGNGGAVNAGLDVTITNSTMSGNTGFSGGAVFTVEEIRVTNSTITGNTGTENAGAFRSGDHTTLVYATVAQNITQTVGAPANVYGSVTSFGSVIALGQGGPNCGFGVPTSTGFNFSDDASCGLTAGGDRQSAGDPGLDALAANGGSTPTRYPAPGSPLPDSIPSASCDPGTVTADQRGIARPQNGSCDIGAVEVEAAPPVSSPSVCPASSALLPGTPDVPVALLIGVAPVALLRLWRRRDRITRGRGAASARVAVLAGAAVVVIAACGPVKPPVC